MRLTTAILTAATLLTAAPTVASASTVLLLPPVVEPNVPPAVIAATLAEITAAVTAAGHSIARPGENMSPSPCETDRCLAGKTSEASADLSLELAFFQDGSVSSATLVLFQPPSHSYYAPLPLTPAIGTSVATAVAALFNDLAQGPGPWLVLTGSPKGAEVTIDGEVVGRLPYRGNVSRGEHFISLQAMGYADYSTTTRVDRYANTTVERSITMQPLSAPVTVSPPAPTSQPSSFARFKQKGGFYYLSGATLVGLGVAYVVSALMTRAKNGDCSEREGSYCASYYEYRPAKLYAGLATVGAGAVLIAVPRLVLTLGADTKYSGSAVLNIKGSF